MKIERAMEILDPNHREHYESIDIVNEACEMGRHALEKRVPKKPKGETDPMFGDVRTVCPNCGNGGLVNPFSKSKVYDFCPDCGQALDWR